MCLRVEVWAAEPPGDLDDWQEAFLTGLVVGNGGLLPVSDSAVHDGPCAVGQVCGEDHRARVRSAGLAWVNKARRCVAVAVVAGN